MLANSVRRFDLYDFFSVLLPGTALVFGLFPLFPRSLAVTSLGALAPLILGGFVIGRALHSASVQIEAFFERTTHRELFIRQLLAPTIISEQLADRFYEACRDEFDLDDMPETRPTEGHEELLETLYGLVRSYIHIDSRGRSRTFQAIYAFHRSMWFASIFLIGVYFVYGLLASFNLVGRIIDNAYISHVGWLEFPPGLIVLGTYIFGVLTYETFSSARQEHQRHYVRYLLSDFVIVERDASGDGSRFAERPSSPGPGDPERE